MIKNKEITYLNKAAEYAKNSNIEKGHGAIICKNGKHICSGYNHTRSSYYNNVLCSTHAEIDALRKLIHSYTSLYNERNLVQLRRKTKKYIIYTSRSNISINSTPCTYCMIQLNNYGITKIVCSNGTDTIYSKIKYSDIHLTRLSPVSKLNAHLKVCVMSK